MQEMSGNGGNGRPAIDDEILDAAGSFALWDRIYVLRRRWWVLLLCAIAGGAIAQWKIRSVVPMYQAEATVQRKQERSPLENVAVQATSDMASELEILRSTAVLGSVVDFLAPGLNEADREDSVKTLRRSLVASPLPGTSLIRVTFRHPDPQYAADVVNRTATAYQAFSARKARDEATRRRQFIANRLSEVTDSARAAQQALADYQSAAGMLDPGDRGSAVNTALVASETEVRELRYHEGLLQNILSGLRGTTVSDDALRRTVVLGRDIVPGVSELYGRLQQYELERSRLTAGRFGETRQGVNVQVLDSLIANTKDDIRAMTEQSLNAIRTRLQAATTRLNELQVEQGGLPQRASQFTRLRQRADAAQQTFDQLAARYYEAQVAEAVEGGKVEIVDAATVPRQPTKTSNPRLLIFAIVLGLIVGAFIAFLMEFLDRKIRTPKDAEDASRLKLLGAIPKLAAKAGGRPLVMMTDDATAAGESFRMLRTALHFAKVDNARVIAITSAGPGEGKSVIASNLAIAIARQGSTVLLVDADLRRPTIHHIFEFRQTPGLSDVLAGLSTLDKAASTHELPTLRVLTAGTSPPNPAELLSSARFAKFVDQARAEFDVVIIDTPPVLAVTDAAALAQYIDGVLLVARAEFSQRHAIVHATATLRHVRAPLLGVVLNCIPRVGRYGRYGSHYGYYGYTYTDYYRTRSQTPERSPKLTKK